MDEQSSVGLQGVQAVLRKVIGTQDEYTRCSDRNVARANVQAVHAVKQRATG